jgi:CheY-like chemotaxis protein
MAEGLAANAQVKGLELVCLIAPEARQRFIGDSARLRQVILNLAGNAIKFTDSGEVVIEAKVIDRQLEDRRLSETSDSMTLSISVRDTGIGIDPAKFESLFQPFSQIEGSTSRRYGGTGLGLAISKQLVGLMGGEIGVKSNSENGQGTEFWFTAKFDNAPDLLPLEEDRETIPVGARVLVVNDHAANRRSLIGYLDLWQCRHAVTAHGEEALDLLRHAHAEGDPFAAVVIDQQLGQQLRGVTNAKIVSRIRHDTHLHDLGIVLISPLIERAEPTHVEHNGAVQRVSKPVKRAAFQHALATALQHKTAAQPLPVEGELLITNGHSVEKVHAGNGSGMNGNGVNRNGANGTGSNGGDHHSGDTITKAAPHQHEAYILLVEDNAVNQLVGVTMLKKLGYRVDLAANGEEAVDALQKTNYDLVLMDIQMPGMDGHQATVMIRDPQSPVLDHHVPVIAMTANVLPGDREACLRSGMNDFISKPIRPTELSTMLTRWLVVAEKV